MKAPESARWAGALLLIGAVQFVVEMAVEQLLIPGYSAVSNAISDLGGLRDAGCPHCGGPYRIAFDVSVALVGLTAIVATVWILPLLPKRRSLRVGLVLLIIAGLGAIGVGIFNENDGAIHGVMASIAFIGGGLALLALGRGFSKIGEDRGFAIFTFVCGIVDLLSLVLFSSVLGFRSGYGGLSERMIVAPVLLWAAVYGLKLLQRRARLALPSTASPAPTRSLSSSI